MLQIALPNKGTLAEDALALVNAAGYHCRRYGRELVVRDAEHGAEFLFLRPRDIAIYVSKGVLDLGITGQDLAIDSQADVTELLPLGFARSALYYAVPQQSTLTPDDFTDAHRIATSFPTLVAQDLKQRNRNAQIIRLDGAVEISVQLGVADAIADVVQSGRTLDEAGLKKTGPAILTSEAVLIARDAEQRNHPPVVQFLERLRGIVVARAYVMVEYDIPAEQLEAACAVTPGIEAPTVAPLSRPNWKAVKAMARRSHVNRILDDLAELGAKGIIITDIRTCRI